MPDLLRAMATRIANINCCCIHSARATAIHFPCSAVNSIDTIMFVNEAHIILAVVGSTPIKRGVQYNIEGQ